jgi:hypothetical protein
MLLLFPMKNYKGVKMKKTISILSITIVAAILLMTTFAIANGVTKWSLRGMFDESNIVSLPTGTADTVWGNLNSYANIGVHNQSQGYVYAQGNKTNGDWFRLSVNWKHRGNNYEITSYTDSPTTTIIDAKARVIYNGVITYMVPITVTYDKVTMEVDVVGPNFDFQNIPVVDKYS